MHIDNRVLEDLLVHSLREHAAAHTRDGNEAEFFFAWIPFWAQNPDLAKIVCKAIVRYLGHWGDSHWTWRILWEEEAEQIFKPQQLIRLRQRAWTHKLIALLNQGKDFTDTRMPEREELFSDEEAQERDTAFRLMLNSK